MLRNRPDFYDRSVTSAEARDTVRLMAAARRTTLAALSRMIRRNEGYLSKYVTTGVPEWLHEDDRRLLAVFFKIDERKLGSRQPWQPPADPNRHRSRGRFL